MKQKHFFLCLILILGINVKSVAQTDPGTANLKHQWTFDNGSATDAIGNVTGTIVGDGSLINNAFVSTNAYMEFPAATIGINSYPEITVEVWCTSSAGKNSGWTMLSYFGESVNGGGKNCTFLSIARGDNVSMATLETTVWDGCTGAEFDDGKMHHFVYTVNATNISLYIDGAFISTKALTAGNTISNISNSLAYLGKGGWTADPNWIGAYHKYSLYDKALSADEIQFLFQKGAEAESVISTTVTSLALDNNYPAEVFSVSSSNLSADIIVTAPAGISVLPTTITKNTADVSLTAIYDGTTAVDGNITLTSGSKVVNIPVKTASDVACFTPLYTNISNIIEDPGLNSLAAYSGWGTRVVSTIINDPTNVYCGAASMKVGNGTATGSGSLNFEFTNTGLLEVNTTYRVKAMVKTVDGSFQIGLWGWNGSAGDLNNVINTNGEWQKLEFTFTTGATLGANYGMFFNNWGCTGTVGYIDNWEMYIAPDPVIAASEKALAFDPEYKTAKFNVTASNIFEDITILAPTGITVSPTTLPADSKGAEVTITWDGTTAVDGKISLSASSGLAEVVIKTAGASNTTCFSPLYANKTNLMPEPYMNNASAFGGWGGKGFISIIDNPDSVYCGSHSARIIGSGSVDVPLAGIIRKNTSYIARAMLRTFGGSYQLGVGGVDVNGAASDVNAVYDTQGAWQAVTLEFTTGDSLRVNNQPFFVNNWQLTGTRAFIDNLELYEKEPNAVIKVADLIRSVYVSNGKIVAEFDLAHAAVVDLAIYNIQGAMISNMQKLFTTGRNRNVFDTELPNGVYLVRMIQDGKTQFTKVIK